MLKQDKYLINTERTPLKLSNLKQPIYYKLQPEIIANYGSFIAHYDNPNYKLLQDYYKLRQNFFTNYGSFITNDDSGLLQVTAALILKNSKLLQITAGITNYDVITKYVVTPINNNFSIHCCIFHDLLNQFSYILSESDFCSGSTVSNYYQLLLFCQKFET